MTIIQRLSIRTKLILLATASGCGALLLACVGFVSNDVKTLKTAKLSHMQTQAELLAYTGSPAVAAKDAEQARTLLHLLKQQPTIDYAGLYDARGQLIADYLRPGALEIEPPPALGPGFQFTDSGYLELFHPVDGEDKLVGMLFLRDNMSDLQQQFTDYIAIATIVAVSSLAASLLFSMGLQGFISRPILKLATTAKKITSYGDYSFRVVPESDDELGMLYHSFNRMLDQVEISKTALRSMRDEMEERVVERTARLEREIIQREQVQVDLKNALGAAEAANHAKSEFLANMSHEIRTPLNAIMGFSDLLRRGADNGVEVDRQEYLDTIWSSGRHLLNVIKDILDISKIEAGQLDTEIKLFSPQELIAEIASVLGVRSREKGLSLEYDWPDGLPELIESDPARLRQAMINLVGNAIKFTERGGVKIRARIESDGATQSFVVEVSDTGIGIPADKIDAVFEPFVQADSSVTRRFGGTGLGLAITRTIAEALGGQLTATSGVGQGSTFRLSVAAGSTARLAGVAESPQVMGHDQVDHPDMPADLTGVRVLLVEDGPTNQRLMTVYLHRANAEVVQADHGEVGLEAALTQHFDVILMDMQMPVMDGYTATRALRANGIRTPVVAMTAHAMKGDEEKCLAAGCSRYLTKPVNEDELIRAIQLELMNDSHDIPPVEQPDDVEEQPEDMSAIMSTLPVDDVEFAEIVEEFVERLRLRLSELRRASAVGDFKFMARVAHDIKGAGGAAGFRCLMEPAGQLEQFARAEQDVSGLEDAIDHLERLASRIVVPAILRRPSTVADPTGSDPRKLSTINAETVADVDG